MIQAAYAPNPRYPGNTRSEAMSPAAAPVRKKAKDKGYFLQVPCVLLEAYRTRFTPLAHTTLRRFLSHYLTWERDQATYHGSYRALARALDMPCSTLTGAVQQWERVGIAQVSDDGQVTITVALAPLWHHNVAYSQQHPKLSRVSTKGQSLAEVSKNQTAELSSSGSVVQNLNTAVQNLNTTVQNLDKIVQNLNTFGRERVLLRIKNLQESFQNLFLQMEEATTSPEEAVAEPGEKKACFSSFSEVSEQRTEMMESSVVEGILEEYQVPASKGSAEEGSDLPDHGNIHPVPFLDTAPSPVLPDQGTRGKNQTPPVLPDQRKRTERQIPPVLPNQGKRVENQTPPVPGGRSIPKKSPPVPTNADQDPGTLSATAQQQSDATGLRAKEEAIKQREGEIWALFDRLFGCRVGRYGYNPKQVRGLAENVLATDATIEQAFQSVAKQAEDRKNPLWLTITNIANVVPGLVRTQQVKIVSAPPSFHADAHTSPIVLECRAKYLAKEALRRQEALRQQERIAL